MRITQSMIYDDSVTYMNNNLSQIMESNVQASSMKKVNKPSDDPAGTAQIFSYNSTLRSLSQYSTNITLAQGWLSLADTTLSQTSTIVTQIKGLAEQAATGTVTAENRDEIASQVQQLFEQLIGQANTDYNGSTVFAGQRTDKQAFVETLAITSNDASLESSGYTISGDTDNTVLVQFLTSGTLSSSSQYRYSSDGGDTWTTGTVSDPGSPAKFQLSLGSGLTLSLDRTTSVTANSATDTNDASGTWVWVRPAAKYVGGQSDTIEVDPLQSASVSGRASGTFSNNVMVRIDSSGSLGSAVSYSYSLDGGLSWVHSNTSLPSALGSSATLPLPGGQLILSNAGGGTLNVGDQYIVRPYTSKINVNISPTEQVTINGVGKDIFGGIYQSPTASNATAVAVNGSVNNNLLETVGKLIGYLQTNNQTGVQECLENLTSSDSAILTYAANVGGRENRLTSATNIIDNLTENQTDGLSSVEDVDVSVLMTKLSQQQIAYQAVLKSTSMVMQMSLMDYV